jgi:hypothetical protein
LASGEVDRKGSRGDAAKPLTLYPMEFEEAMKALLAVDPDDLEAASESPSPPAQKKSKRGN